MSLTQEQKEIALRVAHRTAKTYRHGADEPYSFDEACMIHALDLFRSSIREEQEADAWIVEYDNAPPSLFNQHPTAHIFGAVSPLFKIPPSPECDCNELLEALEKIVEACYINEFTPTGSFLNEADALIAKHKAMKGER